MIRLPGPDAAIKYLRLRRHMTPADRLMVRLSLLVSLIALAVMVLKW